MSPFNYNNVVVRVKRLPFVDRTNVTNQEGPKAVLSNGVCSKKGNFEYFASLDPKFKLKLKVHLKPYNITANKKFLHNASYLHNLNPVVEQIVSNDPKFNLNPKVHLRRLNIAHIMPNLQSTKALSRDNALKRNGRVTQVPVYDVSSTNSNLKSGEVGSYVEDGNHKFVTNGDKGMAKSITHLNNRLPGLKKTVPNDDVTKIIEASQNNGKKIIADSKFHQQVIVEVSRCKQLEKALKAKDKPEQTVKKVHFTHDTDSTPKFDKTLRKRQKKNYAELSFKDNLSSQENTEHIYREHVPVYLQNAVIEQKKKEKDPFEFHSESFTIDLKKKKRRGRPRKEILSPLQQKKRKIGRPTKEDPSDSDSSLYDKSMHKLLKKVRLKLSPKKCKYRKHMKDESVKQNSNLKRVTNQIRNVQQGIVASRMRQKNFTGELNRNKKGVVSNTIVKAGPRNIPTQVLPPRTQPNFNTVVNENANNLISNINNKAGPSKNEGNRNTADLRTQEIEIVSSRISRAASQSSVSVKDDCDRYFGFDEVDSEDDDISKFLSTAKGSSGLTRLDNIKPVAFSQRFTSLTSTPLPNIQTRSLKAVEPKKKVNIISNVVVSSPRTTRSKIQTGRGVLKAVTPPVGETSTLNSSPEVPVVEKDFLGFENSNPGPSTLTGLSSKALVARSIKTSKDLMSSFRIMRNMKQTLQDVPKASVGDTLTLDSSSKTPAVENDFLGFDNSKPGPSTSAALSSKPSLSKSMETSKSTVPGFDSSIQKSNIDQTQPLRSDLQNFGSASNRPFAGNITIRRQLLNQKTSSPWRVDGLHIRRNPHLLAMKDTSLPCFNQEMVLEPKLVERPVTPLHTYETQSSKVQKSILDFVNSNKNSESTPVKKNHDKTLFDENEFSPIKSKKSDKNSTTNTNSTDENDRTLVLQNPKGGRNIFGVRKKKNEIPPLRPSNKQNTATNLHEEFGVENYFGFDSPDDKHAVGKENIRITRSRAQLESRKNEDALPTRVPIKQLKKVREEVVEELLDKVNVEENATEERTLQEAVENASLNEEPHDDVPHVGLFEDFEEVKPPPRMYSRKRTKRVRVASVDTDLMEEEKPRRKRKDIRTAAEEEEFNKWAAAFNAMCDEVEKHNLETD